MYEIALSVNACVNSNTRADVAWLVHSSDSVVPISFDAIAITPGGGKIGNLINSAFDGPLIEQATRKLPTGRIITRVVSDFESTMSNIPAGTTLKFAVMPSNAIENGIWQALLERESIAIVCHIEGDEIVKSEYFTSVTIIAADPQIAEEFSKSKSATLILENQIVTIYHPITKLVIAGSGPIADALAKAAQGIGWNVSVDPRPSIFVGLTATLSPMDCAVIMGHDVESSSNCLKYALESKAGYIGALGSKKMQESREDWLNYRDITDISRVHGPAGFDIGAATPDEIAISILAEAIAVLKGV
ncbi:MAG: XdhC family protein [Candidatus Planktophila sp.]|jgi:xanthine dehydrogenase accessory factor|tara:strand:- start:2556 stop:3464 length:909 start_codon:yes stop_codon:yes gene_type:complete